MTTIRVRVASEDRGTLIKDVELAMEASTQRIRDTAEISIDPDYDRQSFAKEARASLKRANLCHAFIQWARDSSQSKYEYDVLTGYRALRETVGTIQLDEDAERRVAKQDVLEQSAAYDWSRDLRRDEGIDSAEGLYRFRQLPKKVQEDWIWVEGTEPAAVIAGPCSCPPGTIRGLLDVGDVRRCAGCRSQWTEERFRPISPKAFEKVSDQLDQLTVDAAAAMDAVRIPAADLSGKAPRLIDGKYLVKLSNGGVRRKLTEDLLQQCKFMLRGMGYEACFLLAHPSMFLPHDPLFESRAGKLFWSPDAIETDMELIPDILVEPGHFLMGARKPDWTGWSVCGRIDDLLPRLTMAELTKAATRRDLDRPLTANEDIAMDSNGTIALIKACCGIPYDDPCDCIRKPPLTYASGTVRIPR